MAQITIKLDVEIHEKLKESACRDSRTVSGQIDYLLKNRIILEDISEKLQGTPAGGVSEKEKPSPQKSSGLKPVRSKSLVQSELWAAEKKLKNVVQEVQGMSIAESLADEEAERYGEALKEEYRAEIENLQYELSGMEG